jgi:hypothetical protein
MYNYTDKSQRAEIQYLPQPAQEDLTEDAKKLSELLSARKQAGEPTMGNPSLLAGTHRLDIVDGRATYTHETPHTGTASPVNRNAGILASATDNAGMPVVNLNDQCLVDLGGMRTTIETAVLLGYLVKHGPGQYSEPGQAPYAPAPRSSSPQSAAPKPSAEDDFSDFEEMDRLAEQEAEALRSSYKFVDGETEAQIEGVYRTLGNQNAENLVNRYFGAQSTGNVGALEQLATEYGGQLGVDPGVLKGQMGGILEKFTEQGARYMNQAHGIDGRDAIEWARENLAPESIMRLAQMQFFKGDLRGYDELATAYKWEKKRKLS